MSEYKIIDLKDTSFGETAVLPNFMSETIQDIHNNMLSNASDDISKIEGDFFWDATRSAAIEIDKINNNIKYLFQSYMVDFAEGYFLDELAKTKFIKRTPAANSVINIEVEFSDSYALKNSEKEYYTFDSDVTFYHKNKLTGENIAFTGRLYYKVRPPEMGGCDFSRYATLTCSTPGSIGNLSAGSILTVDPQYENVFKFYNFKSIEKFGFDTETDDELRERLKILYKSPPSCGSISDYIRWCLEINGVSHVIHDYNPSYGRVSLILLDKNYNLVPPEIINAVTDNINSKGPIFQKTVITSLHKEGMSFNITITSSQGGYFWEGEYKEKLIRYCKEKLEKIFNDNYKAKKIGYIKYDFIRVNFLKVLSDYFVENNLDYNVTLIIKNISIGVNSNWNKDLSINDYCYYVIENFILNVNIES